MNLVKLYTFSFVTFVIIGGVSFFITLYHFGEVFFEKPVRDSIWIEITLSSALCIISLIMTIYFYNKLKDRNKLKR